MPGKDVPSSSTGLHPSESFTPDSDGIYSADKIIERLVKARDAAGKSSSRYTTISLVLTSLYLVRVAGLNPDVVLFGQHLAKLPYGTFLFCVLAQGAMCASVVNAVEENLHDRRLKCVLAKNWPDQSESAYRSFPKTGSLFTPAKELVEGKPMGLRSKLFFNTTFILSAVAALSALLAPIVAGFEFVMDWRRQITSGNVPLQYYTVLASTTFALLWTLNYFVIDAVAKRAVDRS